MKKARQRNRSSGVTLIEMLVVLALFAVLAGLVVLAVPSASQPLKADVDARRLASALNDAVADSLLTGQGFALQTTSDGLRIVQKGLDGTWVAHSNPKIAKLKLLPADTRNTVITGQLFEVSSDLVPNVSEPLVVKFGDRAAQADVIFDGARARVIAHDTDRKN